jgi:hypothetical protein
MGGFVPGRLYHQSISPRLVKKIDYNKVGKTLYISGSLCILIMKLNLTSIFGSATLIGRFGSSFIRGMYYPNGFELQHHSFSPAVSILPHTKPQVERFLESLSTITGIHVQPGAEEGIIVVEATDQNFEDEVVRLAQLNVFRMPFQVSKSPRRGQP